MVNVIKDLIQEKDELLARIKELESLKGFSLSIDCQKKVVRRMTEWLLDNYSLFDFDGSMKYTYTIQNEPSLRSNVYMSAIGLKEKINLFYEKPMPDSFLNIIFFEEWGGYWESEKVPKDGKFLLEEYIRSLIRDLAYWQESYNWEGNKVKVLEKTKVEQEQAITELNEKVNSLTETLNHWKTRAENAEQEVENLKIELAGEREAFKDYEDSRISFYQLTYPQEFAELERKVGVENMSMKNFIQLLLWKEQKVRLEKQEIEKQKEGQIRQKSKIDSKYRVLKENVRKLDQSKKEIIQELNQKEIAIQNLNGLITELNAEKEQNKQKYNELESNYNTLNTSYQQIQKGHENLKQTSQKQVVELATNKRKLNKRKTTIQKLKEEKEDWQQREQELLAEIEHLKNPPRSENQESISIETEKYQTEIKVLAEKLPAEQIKIINSVWQEAENKHNQQLTQLQNQLTVERERERESKNSFEFSEFSFCCR